MKAEIKKYNLNTLVLFVLLALEVVLLVYYNLITTYSMDCDSAKVMYHTIKIIENKTLYIPNWVYMTTGEWDCTSFLAMPLYLLTNNIFLSFSISNIINIILFILIVYVLMSSLDIKVEYILITLCIIFIPYKWGMLEYTNMLFYSAGQYVYKVLTPLSLLALLHYNKKSKVGYYLLLIFTILLVVLTTTSSSLYVVTCAIVPILASRVLYLLAYNKKPKLQNIKEIFIVCIFILLSYIIHKKSGIATSGDSARFIGINNFVDILEENVVSFIGIMGLLPPVAGTKIFSCGGVCYLLKTILFGIIVIFGFSNLNKMFSLNKLLGFKKENEDNRELIKIELISVFVFNCFISLVTYLMTNTRSRYLLIGFVCLVILAVIIYSEKDVNRWFKYFFIILILMLNVFSINSSLEYIKTNNEVNYTSKDTCLNIINIAKENDLENIVIYDESGLSEIMRIYDLDINVYTYNTDGKTLIDYDVVDIDNKQVDTILKNCLFIVNDKFLDDDLPKDIMKNNEQIDKINIYNIYKRIE